MRSCHFWPSVVVVVVLKIFSSLLPSQYPSALHPGRNSGPSALRCSRARPSASLGSEQLMENWFLYYHWRLSRLMLVWFSIFSEFLLHYWQKFWIYLIILSIYTCLKITRKSFFSSIFGFIFNFIFSRSWWAHRLNIDS